MVELGALNAQGWPEGPRRAALFGGSLLAVGVLLVAKWVLVGLFVQDRVPGAILAFGLLGTALWQLASRLRMEAGDAALTVAPALAILLISVVNTPMAFEMESFAERLPHPEGASEVDAVVQRPFRSGHPTARVEWVYAEDADATALTRALADALSSGGWRVTSEFPPEGTREFGFVVAARWDFQATCNVWQEPRARIACSVTA